MNIKEMADAIYILDQYAERNRLYLNDITERAMSISYGQLKLDLAEASNHLAKLIREKTTSLEKLYWETEIAQRDEFLKKEIE